MLFTPVLQGVVKGLAEASGNEAAANDISQQQAQQRQRQQLELKQKLAPLTQASAGLQQQIVNLTDPATGKPYAGQEERHAQLVDQLANVVGKTRMTLHPPPAEDPHGLGYLAHVATDKLHITNDAAQRAREAHAAQVNQYYQGLNDQSHQAAQQMVAGQGNPLTPEQQAQAVQIHAGITPKAVAPKAPVETADTRARQDYKLFLEKNPDYEAKGGTFESFKSMQSTAGHDAIPKPKTFDQQYQDVLLRQQKGERMTEDDKALETAWNIWNRKTKIEPGVARAAAFGANRYIMVVDPQNPEQVIPMRAGEAAQAHVGTPASIGYKTDAAMSNYMTSGKGGQNLTAFHTAIDHLKLLKQAGDALKNGDIKLFNKWANQYAVATGQAAPTNFNAVKGAVVGEIAKTFSDATIPQLHEISATIDNASSDDQIAGATDYYLNLMDGKVRALDTQYHSAKPGGKPDFTTSKPAMEGPKTQELRGMQGGGGYIYAKDPQGGVHRAKPGTPLPKGWTVTNAPN